MSPALARARSTDFTRQPAPASRFARDAAVDFFRGFGLWMVFIDHLAPNIWSHVTLWRFGFCDFAEVFVFLSGFINVGSWERVVNSGDAMVVGKKLARRIARLYVAHVASLSVSIALIALARNYHWQINDPKMYSWVQDPTRCFVGIFTLTYAPHLFSLLPFYLVVAPLLPLMILGLMRAPIATLVLSSTLWAASQIPWFQALVRTHFLYFQPLAWQFLLVLGAAVRYFSSRLSAIGRSRWIIGGAAAIAGVSVVLKSLTLFPWTLAHLNPWLHSILMRDSGKRELAPYRLIYFLALVILAHVIVSWRRDWLRWFIPRVAIGCGADSLFIYACALILNTAGNLTLAATHAGICIQLLVSITGIGLLWALAGIRGAVPASQQARSHPD